MIDILALAALCAPDVGEKTLLAIITTESGGHPFAIGDNTDRKSIIPKTKNEAVTIARQRVAKGNSLDLGLGQINSRNLPKLGMSIEDAFDPCKNIKASATILSWGYTRAKKKIEDNQDALRAAISAYNTGSLERGFLNGYVDKVIDHAGKKLLVPNIEFQNNTRTTQKSASSTRSSSRSSAIVAPLIVSLEQSDSIDLHASGKEPPPKHEHTIDDPRISPLEAPGF
jgi:type IV secretion system protein VirB1